MTCRAVLASSYGFLVVMWREVNPSAFPRTCRYDSSEFTHGLCAEGRGSEGVQSALRELSSTCSMRPVRPYSTSRSEDSCNHTTGATPHTHSCYDLLDYPQPTRKHTHMMAGAVSFYQSVQLYPMAVVDALEAPAALNKCDSLGSSGWTGHRKG